MAFGVIFQNNARALQRGARSSPYMPGLVCYTRQRHTNAAGAPQGRKGAARNLRGPFSRDVGRRDERGVDATVYNDVAPRALNLHCTQH